MHVPLLFPCIVDSIRHKANFFVRPFTPPFKTATDRGCVGAVGSDFQRARPFSLPVVNLQRRAAAQNADYTDFRTLRPVWWTDESLRVWTKAEFE